MSETIPDQIGCIVLAAGSSKRFGSDKRQHLLPTGKSVLISTLELLEPLFEERVLVLKPEDEALAKQFSKEWEIVIASEASKGMGHSLAAAIPCAAQWQGAVIALADMPWVQAESIIRIKSALTPHTLVLPFYQGQRGNPVGIGRDYFKQLAALQGDSGARQLLQEQSSKVIKLDIEDPGLVKDLDTPPG